MGVRGKDVCYIYIDNYVCWELLGICRLTGGGGRGEGGWSAREEGGEGGGGGVHRKLKILTKKMFSP